MRTDLHRIIRTATRPRRRVALSAGFAILAVAALSGCAAGEPAMEPIDVGEIASDATAPGTTLALGDTAWIWDEGSGTAGEMFGVTVLEVNKIDPATIKGFSDNPEFTGYTPYGVVTQYSWKPASEFDGRKIEIDVLPVTADGTLGGWVANNVGNIALGSPDVCGVKLPEFKSGSGVNLTCFVGLSKTDPIAGAVYNGTDRNAVFATDDHPFAAEPITWLKK